MSDKPLAHRGALIFKPAQFGQFQQPKPDTKQSEAPPQQIVQLNTPNQFALKPKQFALPTLPSRPTAPAPKPQPIDPKQHVLDTKGSNQPFGTSSQTSQPIIQYNQSSYGASPPGFDRFKNMSSGLQIFLIRIFDDETVMKQKDGPTRSWLIYKYYSGEVVNAAASTDAKFLADVWLLAKKHNRGKEVFFQNVKKEDESHVYFHEINDRISKKVTLAGDYYQSFIYFLVGVNLPKYRLYLNIGKESILQVVEAIMEYQKGSNHGTSDFKIAGPQVTRSDTIVVYCEDAKAAAKLGHSLLDDYGKCFKSGVMPMTDYLVLANGVAIGAEPNIDFVTDSKDVPKVSQYSFGSLRADLIARAIPIYHARMKLGFNSFAEVVSEQFKENGIDPKNPATAQAKI